MSAAAIESPYQPSAAADVEEQPFFLDMNSSNEILEEFPMMKREEEEEEEPELPPTPAFLRRYGDDRLFFSPGEIVLKNGVRKRVTWNPNLMAYQQRGYYLEAVHDDLSAGHRALYRRVERHGIPAAGRRQEAELAPDVQLLKDMAEHVLHRFAPPEFSMCLCGTQA